MASPEIENEISAIIQREGGYVNNKDDAGGPTFEGISKNANPEAWRNGQPTDAQVREIYRQKYVVGPGFDKIADPKLQAQLVDYGVTSSPLLAIQKLQTIIGVHADGVLGPQTLAVLATKDPRTVNNSLMAARIMMICKIVQSKPSQLQFLGGWVSRSLEFMS